MHAAADFPYLAPPSPLENGSRGGPAAGSFGIRNGVCREVAYFFFSPWGRGFRPHMPPGVPPVGHTGTFLSVKSSRSLNAILVTKSPVRFWI